MLGAKAPQTQISGYVTVWEQGRQWAKAGPGYHNNVYDSITTTCCQLVTDLLRTCWSYRYQVLDKSVTSCLSTGKLRENVCNGFWA